MMVVVREDHFWVVVERDLTSYMMVVVKKDMNSYVIPHDRNQMET